MSTVRFIAVLVVVFFAVVGAAFVNAVYNDFTASAEEQTATATPASVLVTVTPVPVQATDVPSQPTAVTQPTAVPAQPTAMPTTAVPALLQGCAGPGCVVRDFDPDRTGVNETNTFPVYVSWPQEVWSAGIDENGEWTVWFAVDTCVTTLTITTGEHNTITFQDSVNPAEVGEARKIWVDQLLNAPNSPYSGKNILYCTDQNGYR